MAKKISKTEALKLVKGSDAIEILFEFINRKEQTSSKRSQLTRFSKEVQKQIQDERDVILISIKVK